MLGAMYRCMTSGYHDSGFTALIESDKTTSIYNVSTRVLSKK